MNKVLSIFKVLLFEFVASVVLLLLVSFVMYKGGFSQGTAKILVLAVYVLSTFLGGMVMGKAQQSKRLVWGFVAGAMYFVVLMLVALAVKSGFTAENNIILAAACCVLGGCFGGMMS